MPSQRVLCASSSEAVRQKLAPMLNGIGHVCTEVNGVDSAIEALRRSVFDAVIADVGSLGIEGVRIITEAHTSKHPCACILLRAEGDADLDLSFLPAGSVAGGLPWPTTEAELQENLLHAVRMVQRKQSAPPARDRCRALCVMPERVESRLVQTLLHMCAIDVEMKHESTLAGALALASAQDFDVVFVDLMLSDARGSEAARRLKTLRPELALVVITDEAEVCRTSMFEVGVLEVLSKAHLTKEALAQAVRSALLRKTAEQRAAALAFRDALTGLHNARYFHRRLSESVAMARRERSPVALFLLDLDGFKAVNDTRGHMMGDFALAGTAQRLGECVRGYDVLARLGGDEFAFLVHRVAETADLTAVAARVQEALTQPLLHPEGDIVLGVSIGIAIAPFDASEGTELLRAADQAMYAAKQAGGGHRFASAQRASMVERTVGGARVRHELLLSSAGERPERLRVCIDGAAQLDRALADYGPRAVGLDGREAAVTLAAGRDARAIDLESLVAAAALLRAHMPQSDLRLEWPLSCAHRDKAAARRLFAQLKAVRVPLVLTGLGADLLDVQQLAERTCAGLGLAGALFQYGREPILRAMVNLSRAYDLRTHASVPDPRAAAMARDAGIDEVLVAVALGDVPVMAASA